MGSRCGIRCGAGIRRPTGWRMRLWIGGWGQYRDQGSGVRGQVAGAVGGGGGVGMPAVVVAPAAAPVKRVVLEGYVKGGVVHLLEGELPDGVFVKVIRE